MMPLRRRDVRDFSGEPLFLGLDLSTQSITAAVLDGLGHLIHHRTINFDQGFPAYGTTGGVLTDAENPTVVHGDPLLWAEALEALMGDLAREGVAPRVAAVACSAQQHGTVYLKPGFAEALDSLDPTRALAGQMAPLLARRTAPVWMDSSTTRECREITAALGGDAAVAALTGSLATERFAAPQIRRFFRTDPQGYEATGHIALVSSFVTSLLAGRIAPVDGGDGFGTNLADLTQGQWSLQALDATAPGLVHRLPPLVTRDGTVGSVAPFWRDRFGFPPEASVVTGSGDNPCSLVGLGLLEDETTWAVSLGTSDTLFGYRRKIPTAPRTEGHLFGAADGGVQMLLCFKNGSLTREHIRNAFGLSWGEFSDLLLATPPGNGHRGMLPWLLPEITPRVLQPGLRFFGGLTAEDAPGCVRGVAEAQACALRLHARWMGPRPKSLLVTAGGSENPGILRVLADVFGVPVKTMAIRDSAALGAALRAEHRFFQDGGTPRSWRELAAPFTAHHAATVTPDTAAEAQYTCPGGFLERYEGEERAALEALLGAPGTSQGVAP